MFGASLSSCGACMARPAGFIGLLANKLNTIGLVCLQTGGLCGFGRVGSVWWG